MIGLGDRAGTLALLCLRAGHPVYAEKLLAFQRIVERDAGVIPPSLVPQVCEELNSVRDHFQYAVNNGWMSN